MQLHAPIRFLCHISRRRRTDNRRPRTAHRRDRCVCHLTRRIGQASTHTPPWRVQWRPTRPLLPCTTAPIHTRTCKQVERTETRPAITWCVEQPKEKPIRKVSVDDFSMPERSEAKVDRHIPVNSIRDRINQFVDDKTEHTDIATPNVELTERRNPSKMLSQKCQECGQIFDVHESHKREWFVCDACLSGRRR